MPGHGDHWGTLCEIDAYLCEKLPRDCREGKVVGQAPCMDVEHGTERIEEVACLRWGSNCLASQVLLVSDSTNGSHYLFSGYPVALAGIVHRVTIEQVVPWQYGIEGWIHVPVTAAMVPFNFFDTMFFMHGDRLQRGQQVDFSLAGLAYQLRPIRVRSFKISDGPMWERERERRLDEGETPERAARPVELRMTGAAIFLPCEDEDCDEAQFQGVIEALDVFEHDGQKIYRMEIVVMRPGDDELKLPVFASEWVLEGYVPRLGEDVEGAMWLQGRKVGAENTRVAKTEIENIRIA